MMLDLRNYTNIRRATLIRLESPLSTALAPIYLYYTDYSRSITYNGITYKSDVVQNIKNIKFTTELTAHKVKVQFSGLIEEQLSIALDNSSSFLNKTIRISQLFLDPLTEEPVLTEGAVVLFEGLITGSSLSDRKSGNRHSSIIEWDCSNHFQDFQQVVGRITDDYAHRGMVVVNGQWAPSIATKRPEYATDKGFFHANKSISILAKYQTEETKYRMVKKKNWHGLSSSYNMQEYTEEVTREVDIRFDLSAKFLPIVYGVQKIPSIPIFADTDKNDPSSVWVVYAICEGEIEGFYGLNFDDAPVVCYGEGDGEDRICFGSKRVTGNTLNNALNPNDPARTAATVHGEHYVYDDGQGEINIWAYHGKSNQEASDVMVQKAAAGEFYLQNLDGAGSEYWDATFKLLDTAYIVVNYKLSDLGNGRTSIPSLDVEVKGLKVKKYSGGTVYSTSTTSNNPAWQLLDYLTSYRYGMSIPVGDISITSFEDVANKFNIIDDSYQPSWVPFWRYLGWDSTDASNRTIMQTNVQFPGEETVFKNVSSLLDQTKSSLNKFGGKYVIQVESDNPSVASLDLDEEAIGDISVKDLTGTSKYNSVSASIIDPGKAWQTNAITFYDAEFKAQDRGVEKKLNLTFSYITNYYTARALVDRELKKSRFSRSVSFTLPFYYLGTVLPSNNIDISYKRYGWVNKQFIVQDVEILYNGSISVTVQEFPASVFINSGQADIGDEQDPIFENKVLPPRDLKFTVAAGMTNPGANVVGNINWLPSLSTDVTHYSLYWEGAPQVILIPKSQGESNLSRLGYDITDLPIGSYTFTVKAISLKGLFSAPVSMLVNIGAAKYLPDVAGFKVINLEPGFTDSFINNFVQLSWDSVVSTNAELKYKLQILDNNDTILREVELPDPINSYTYTLEFNKQDFVNLNGGVGAFRYLRFKIKAIGAGNAISLNWSVIT
jgi:hypothetical protein